MFNLAAKVNLHFTGKKPCERMFCGCRYEVNFQEGIDCGGAYIKLLSDTAGLNLVGVNVFILHDSYVLYICTVEYFLSTVQSKTLSL